MSRCSALAPVCAARVKEEANCALHHNTLLRMYGKGSRPAEPSDQGSLLDHLKCASWYHWDIFIKAMF